MYQQLSDGMLGFSQALKLSDVPFPFPYAQILTWMLITFCCFIPIYIMHFTQSTVAGPVLSFALFQGIWGLNETAKELENPFGPDVNDITLGDFHNRFLDAIDQAYSACSLRKLIPKRPAKEVDRHTILTKIDEVQPNGVAEKPPDGATAPVAPVDRVDIRESLANSIPAQPVARTLHQTGQRPSWNFFTPPEKESPRSAIRQGTGSARTCPPFFTPRSARTPPEKASPRIPASSVGKGNGGAYYKASDRVADEVTPIPPILLQAQGIDERDNFPTLGILKASAEPTLNERKPPSTEEVDHVILTSRTNPNSESVNCCS